MRVLRICAFVSAGAACGVIPVSAHAGIFISVGFAPPVLPVYVQPICPQPNLMWMPGYWAYGEDGYYWVPGAWVPARTSARCGPRATGAGAAACTSSMKATGARTSATTAA